MATCLTKRWDEQATLAFQGLRIAVNRELHVLSTVLPQVERQALPSSLVSRHRFVLPDVPRPLRLVPVLSLHASPRCRRLCLLMPTARHVHGQAVNLLGSGGRLAVISFHSLEDRIVKQYFRDVSGSEQKVHKNKYAREAEPEPEPGSLRLVTKRPVCALGSCGLPHA